MSFGIDPENMSENDLRAALADASMEDQIEIWKQLSGFAWDRREFGNVAAINQTIFDLSIKYSDKVTAARAKFTQGSAHFNGKEFEEAKNSYLAAADLAGSEGVQNLLADSLWAAADSAFSIEDYEESLSLSQQAEKIAASEEEFAVAGKATFLQMKNLYMLDLEEKSLEKRIEARNYYRNIGSIEQVCKVDDYAVRILWYLGRYSEATEIARDVLLKWTVNGSDDWIAYSNYRLGISLQKEGFFEESNQYLETAKTIYLRLSNMHSVADCEQEIGQNYMNLDQYEPCIERMLNARSLWDGVGNDWQAARCDAVRAVAHHMLDGYFEASKLNLRLLDFLDDVDDSSYQDLGYLVRARAADNYLALEDYERVLVTLHSGPELGSFVPATHLLIWNKTLEARALFALGREDEALIAANAAMELTDDDLLNWNSGYIFEIRGNVLLNKNRREGEKDLAHAIALHLANGHTERALELSKIFIPKIDRSTVDVMSDAGSISGSSEAPSREMSPS
jgi:tetratricopeptide (TPR) repeat protein